VIPFQAGNYGVSDGEPGLECARGLGLGRLDGHSPALGADERETHTQDGIRCQDSKRHGANRCADQHRQIQPIHHCFYPFALMRVAACAFYPRRECTQRGNAIIYAIVAEERLR
jgi:hypothetical protein